MAIIPLDEFRRLASYPAMVESDDENKLLRLMSFCWGLIASYTGQDFAFLPGKEVLVHGTDERSLDFNERVVRLHLVCDLDRGVNHPLCDLRVSPNRYKVISSWDRFSLGEYNIRVVGDFGWQEIPEDVLAAFIALCEGNYDLIDNIDNKLTNASGPYESETIGNYKYVLKRRFNEITGQPVDTTGNMLVDSILDKYVKRFVIGVV